MNILLITDNFPPETGGVENVTSLLAEKMSEIGHKITVITLPADGAPEHERRDGYEIFRMRMTFPRLALKGAMDFLLSLFNILRLTSIVRKRKIEVINVHYPVSSAFLVDWLTQKRREIRLILSFHGTDIQRFIPEHPALKRIVHRTALRADAVTACSHYLAGVVEKTLGISGVIAVHNAIPLKDFEEPQGSEGNYIFSIGRFVKKKGFDMLIEAFFRLADDFPDIKLIIAGDGPERVALKKKVKEKGMEDRVNLPGRISDGEKTGLLRGCLFATVPSREEPFGITALEAMAAEKPVLATRVGGIPEVVGDAAVLVEPGVEGIENGLRRLLTEPALRRTLSVKGRTRVEEHFRWERMVERYLHLFEKNGDRNDSFREQII